MKVYKVAPIWPCDACLTTRYKACFRFRYVNTWGSLCERHARQLARQLTALFDKKAAKKGSKS